MISNYHTHTWRCRHASDTEEEYVTRAIKGGFKTLGFSDHTPYWFPGDYYSYFRMYPEQLPDYVDTVLHLKEKYADKIQIHLGLEAEYYPAYFTELLQHLKDHPIEYLILGQHYGGNEIDEPYYGQFITEDATILSCYCDQVVEGIYTGVFSCVAHPDIAGFGGDERIYRQHMRRVCQAANACGIPLELNLLGIRAGRHYPEPKFWCLAGEEGCQVILGCDAHKAVDVWDPQSEQTAMEMVKTYGLQLVQKLPFRSVR